MKPDCSAPISLLLWLVTSRFRIVIVCLLAGLSLFVGCTGSQKTRGSMVDVDVSGWDVLGEIEVQFPWSIWVEGEELTQSYTIQVADQTTRYQKFRVVVHNWAARITELQVVLARTLVSELFKSFKEWGEAAGERPGTLRAFSMALESHGYQKEKTRDGRYFHGLRI